MRSRTKNTAGFTLIEVLIVVVVIGVLAVIAFPSFERYIVKTNRGDAHSTLQNVQLLQERYRATEGLYGTREEIGAPTSSLEGHYLITIPENSRVGYRVLATAQGQQQAREQRLFGLQCQIITLEVNFAGITRTPDECWR